METIMTKKVLKRKVTYQAMVKNLVVKEVTTLGYNVIVCTDEKGVEIVKPYKNVNVRIEEQRVKYDWLDKPINETTLYINDVEYESLGVERVLGDNNNLTILMCVEAD